LGESTKKIRITRVHIEEDTGKLIHAGAARLAGSAYSLVDINIDRIRNGQWYGIVVTRFFAQPMLKTDLVMITADLHEASTNNIIMVQMRIVKEAITVVQAKSVIASIIAGAEQ